MNRLLLSALVTLGCAGHAACQELVLADSGRSEYRIVLADGASPSTRFGAEELQRTLEEMTGVRMPIVIASALDAPLAREILIGDATHPRIAALGVSTDGLGREGYVLRTVGDRLVIAGGGVRGAMYGVFALLEDHLGCRWFTPQVSHIPKSAHLALPALDERVVPRLEYREPFVKDCFDGTWCARNRMNSNAASLDERLGGKVTYAGFVHTFFELVPPAKYYRDHPEYFPLVGGRRLDGYTQLCCTNEDVVRIVTDEIRARMRAHPEATVFSVSQNDTFNHCQCADCQALAEAEGSQIAPVLRLVNRVADAVADEFPDKAIDTLAYQWTRKPPRTMRPRPNVIVRLCSIECCFSHPLATCDSAENRAFRDDLIGWSKVCDRLWVWDYTTSFANYFVPFPNRRVIGPNIRFFADHHVTGIFEEDTYSTLGGELNALDGYVQAKLLWDPSRDAGAVRDEFLAGVYGAAADPIARYLDLLEDEVATKNIHVHIWEGARAAYLTDELLAAADRLWNEADAAVADTPELLERVRIARLGLDWAQIERAPRSVGGRYRIVDGRYAADVDPVHRARVERFFTYAARAGVTVMNEGGLTVAAYRARVAPEVDGFDVVTLEGQDLELQIVPALGGRIVGLRALPDGANLIDRSAPDQPGYPSDGGYAESWRAGAHGPGWAIAFDAVRQDSPDASVVVLTATLADGVQLVRRITVPARGRAFEIESNVVGAPPDASTLRAACSFDLGSIHDLVATASESGEPIPLAFPATEARADLPLPAGGILLVDRASRTGVRIEPGGAPIERAWLRVDAKRSTVTCEWQVATTAPWRERIELVGGVDAVPPAAGVRAHRADRVVVGDDRIGIARDGTWGWIEADATAADGFSIHLPNTHIEWCCQWPCAPADFEPDTRYEVWARVRVATNGAGGPAFWAGIYDGANGRDLGSIQPLVADIAGDGWHEYRLGTITPAAGQYVWCGPHGNPDHVGGVWLDGFELRAVR